MAEISPLRRRMIEDMTVRNLSLATQRSYIRAVSKFSRRFGRSPDKLTLDDVHAFQVHLVSTGISWLSLNQMSARCASSTGSRWATRRFPSGSRTDASRASCRSCSAPMRSCTSLKRCRALRRILPLPWALSRSCPRHSRGGPERPCSRQPAADHRHEPPDRREVAAHRRRGRQDHPGTGARRRRARPSGCLSPVLNRLATPPGSRPGGAFCRRGTRTNGRRLLPNSAGVLSRALSERARMLASCRAPAKEAGMANNANFTREEWTKLLESPMMAGLAITAAEPSGLWCTARGL